MKKEGGEVSFLEFQFVVSEMKKSTEEVRVT
jgi:hypothetical protein